jgi:bifunctional non-homologous end joining protein LigD
MIVRRDGALVRLYSRNANDSTARLPAIAAGAERIREGLHARRRGGRGGPDGLSRFEELGRRETAHKAILYAFDLIEHDGEDLRDLPFLDRKAALAWLLRDTKAGMLLNEHVATVFAHACRLGAEGIVACHSLRRHGRPTSDCMSFPEEEHGAQRSEGGRRKTETPAPDRRERSRGFARAGPEATGSAHFTTGEGDAAFLAIWE